MPRARLFVIALLLMPAAAWAGALPSAAFIQVSGHGSLRVPPDLLHISLTLEQTNRDLSAAKRAVNARAREVIALAHRLGIADRDINAAAIYISPQYDWQNNKQRYLGEHVTRSVQLTLRDLQNYPQLVNGLVRIGVTTLGAVQPGRSDMQSLMAKTLARAVRDAHARAAAIAAGAGVSLGRVYSITDNSAVSQPRPLIMAAGAASSGGPEYEAGSIAITAEITAVYLIGEAH
ncbi:MAG: SIMPL domain-containing protein [Gammaproteobacteria bacterium]